MQHIGFAVMASVVAAGLAACGSSPTYQRAGGAVAPANQSSVAEQPAAADTAGGVLGPATVAVLHVTNNDYAGVKVYAVDDGRHMTELGTVSGQSKGTFAVTSSVFHSCNVQIMAEPIGGAARANSGALLVSRGSTINFTVMPDLPQSSATVR